MTKKTKSQNPIRQMIKQCQLVRPVCLLFVLAWIMKSLMDVTMKIVLGNSIDIGHNTIKGVFPIILICVLCTFGAYMFAIGNRYFLNRYIEKHIKDLRVRAGYHLIHVPYIEVESMQRGDMISRTIGDLEKIQFFFEYSVSEFAITTISGVLGLLVCLVTSWKMTLSLVLTIPVILIINIVNTKSMERQMVTQKREVGAANGMAMNVLQQINTVKSFNLEPLLSGKYFKQLKKIRVSEEKISYKRACLSFVQSLGSVLVYITMMVVGCLLVMKNEMTPGEFVIVLVLVEPLGEFVYQLQYFLYSLKDCKTGSKRVMDILNLSEEDENESNKPDTEQIESLTTSETSYGQDFIKFTDVSFAYQNEEMSEKVSTVLKNVSFSVQKGQKIAVVGASGCGKSTLVKLICALYQTKEGQIIIDGIRMSPSTAVSIRKKIAVVLQENFLFPMTIEENIRCGKPNATYEEVVNAAMQVGIHDFIISLPEGYKTMLGEDGKTVSGGQRQRICIARAYIKKPDILILDEPTAALDTESESVVEHSLERLMEGKTTITVAHRLSTIKGSDLILCMEEGRIVETGTHDELYAQKGRYYCLYNIQMEGVVQS